MKRIIAIDYGDVRTGVAVSDPLGLIATGLETIKEKEMTRLLERLAIVIQSYEPDKIIVGFPINMNGTMGQRAEKTQTFIDALSEHVALPIVKWDERLSTAMAHQTMHAKKKKPSRNKSAVDRIAACHILQSYLDSIK